ncbi:MAG: alpha/beta fold hydrolase BchO [Limnohabitans sp.]
MDWERQREHWPNSDISRFVNAAGVRWHVQQAGTQGPRVLLLHGTGASLHTWRDLLKPLAQHAQVLAIDLPGHGFSSLAANQGMSLPGMAQGVAALLDELAWPVQAFIGHSAGAAIAAQMVLDKSIQPAVLIGINPAWLPLPGLAGLLFPTTAKLLAMTEMVPRWFARQASSPGVLEKLLQSTGSVLDAQGKALYAQLVASPVHAQGALHMMAAWDLSRGVEKLRRLHCPVRLLIGGKDGTVPPAQARQAVSLLQNSALTEWPAYGHLVHEEAAEACLQFCLQHLLLEWKSR